MIQILNELFQFFSCLARLCAKFGTSGDSFRIRRVKSETRWLPGHMPHAACQGVILEFVMGFGHSCCSVKTKQETHLDSCGICANNLEKRDSLV